MFFFLSAFPIEGVQESVTAVLSATCIVLGLLFSIYVFDSLYFGSNSIREFIGDSAEFFGSTKMAIYFLFTVFLSLLLMNFFVLGRVITHYQMSLNNGADNVFEYSFMNSPNKYAIIMSSGEYILMYSREVHVLVRASDGKVVLSRRRY
jgi:hypothetical protein